ncbi:MAG: dephospho-CoA kinase [Synergistaceae bacterium]|jgi:dephospho-CoA kinase|nr:dephospho-CoA kinase [Synergistaceae bacterium]
MFSVAITGEIGSGKSTLAKIWGDMGANVFDLDAIAKTQWRRPEIKEAAARRWGEGLFPDGEPDYRKIAGHVFKDIGEYRFAADLVHPSTITESAKRFHNLRGWVVIEIPLLYEVGWFDLIDYVICVTSTDDLRMGRIASRGWTEQEISVRERFMIGSPKKQAMSDIVMCNIGSMEAWEERAREMGALMLKMSTVHEISVSCKDLDEAGKIMSSLVESRLVAGASAMRVDSTFRWKGEIMHVPEYNIRALTIEHNLRPVMRRVRELHSYEVPAITAREILRSDYQTLKWVVDNCGGE